LGEFRENLNLLDKFLYLWYNIGIVPLKELDMLSLVEYKTVNKRSMWLMRCHCGTEELKRPDHVITGRVRMCKSCSAKETAKTTPPPIRRTGYAGLSGTHYSHIKASAKRRNIEFNVTEKQLWELYEAQNNKCALTGVPIVLVAEIQNNNPNWEVITASLDRKDSSIGYVIENLWWVHKEVNRLKNNYSLEELLFWSRLLLSKHGNPDPSHSGDTAEGATTRDRVSRDSNIPTSAQQLYPHVEYVILTSKVDDIV